MAWDPKERTVSLGGTREEAELARLRVGISEYLASKMVPVTEPLIEEEVEGRTTLKRRALRLLVKDETVTRTGTGKKGDPFQYAIPAPSAEAEKKGEENACSLVPTIYREQENKNPKKALNACTGDGYSCSNDLEDFGSVGNKHFASDSAPPEGAPASPVEVF